MVVFSEEGASSIGEVHTFHVGLGRSLSELGNFTLFMYHREGQMVALPVYAGNAFLAVL